MTDILETILQWYSSRPKKKVYAVTITGLEGSAVRGTGATMAISPEGRVAGSVSGGCIEPALIKDIERLREKSKGEKKSFCPSDDELFGTSSPCGGTVEVVVYPLDGNVVSALGRAARENASLSWAVVEDGPDFLSIGVTCAVDEKGAFVVSSRTDGSKISPKLAQKLEDELVEGNGEEKQQLGEWSVFIRREQPKPRLFIVGGSQIGEALTLLAARVGWWTIVADPRDMFSQEWRFTGADRLIHEWPEIVFERLELGKADAVAAITHNEQMDDEAVAQGLSRGAFYVGVLGGRTTQENRRKRLLERGFTEEQLSRVHGPIGLNLGGRTPEEIALSILSEVVSEYRRGGYDTKATEKRDGRSAGTKKEEAEKGRDG